jgi:hypothetical protein
MISRLAAPRGQLSSRWLASAVAVAYLVISLTVGVVLLTAPKAANGITGQVANTPPYVYQESPGDVPMTLPDVPGPNNESTVIEGPTPSPPKTTSTTTPPPPTAPAGYQRVTGPAGLRTVIPAGWRSERTSGPGAMQAYDPADAGRYVKYGGSAAPDIGIEPSHIQYENGFAARALDYRRIVLSAASYAGHQAVEWEFVHRDAAGYRHVRSLYWRANGKEYFVLAAAPPDRWQETKPIYDAMVAHATP